MTGMKRTIDLAGALLGLLVSAPLWGLIALAIRLQDGGPVFFRQERVGRDGIFRIWKFRTMRAAAGAPITAGHDARITPIGRWLRRCKLDELPQLLNVAAGEMSLVGPRPELPRFVAGYTPEERTLLHYRPGITDPASLRFRDEAALLRTATDPIRTYQEHILPQKLRISLAYARRATVWTDLGVLLSTVRILLPGAGPAAAHSPRRSPVPHAPPKEPFDVPMH